MNCSDKLVVLALAATLAACGTETPADDSNQQQPRLTAATLGEQEILSNSGFLEREPYRSASQRNGERQAQVCTACHSMQQGGPNMVGPRLHGFFGNQAGSVDGFDYSPVLRNADFVWTPRALDAWLAQPGHFLPGNRMTFAGVFKQQDRDDLIAYLLQTTAAE